MINGKPNISQLYLAAIFLFFLNVQAVRPEPPSANQQNNLDAPCHHKELEEFAFLEGDWEVKLNNRFGDGKWEETTATSQIKRDLSGCVLMERLLGSRQNRPFHVLSLFAFDNNSKRLQYLLSDSEHGLLALYQGRMTGSEILLDLEFVRDDGSMATVRRAFSEIKKDSFSLESKHSRDGGKSWLTVMRARYGRKLKKEN